jgi:hypothetical protein
VDATFLGHFVAEESVDHAVASGLHLGGESVGCDDEAMFPKCQRLLQRSWGFARVAQYRKCVSLDVLPAMALW